MYKRPQEAHLNNHTFEEEEEKEAEEENGEKGEEEKNIQLYRKL